MIEHALVVALAVGLVFAYRRGYVIGQRDEARSILRDVRRTRAEKGELDELETRVRRTADDTEIPRL